MLTFVLLLLATLILVIYNEDLQEKLAERRAPRALPEPQPTARLLPEGELESVPSVTEQTTELLAPRKARDTRDV